MNRIVRFLSAPLFRCRQGKTGIVRDKDPQTHDINISLYYPIYCL